MPSQDGTPDFGGVACKKYRKSLDAEETPLSFPSKAEAKAEGDSPFEELLELAGTNGLWNHGMIIIITFGAIPAAFMALSYQFLGYTPEYWCHIQDLHEANWTTQQIIDFAIPRKANGKLEGCLQHDYNYSLAASLGYEAAKDNLDLMTDVANRTVSCLKRDFNLTEYKSTLVTDFDLVCERRALYSTTSSVTQIGMLMASLIVGYATDLFGKRRFIMATQAFLLLFAALAATSTSVGLFLLCAGLQSLCRMAAAIAKYTLVMELNTNALRSYIASAFGMSWALGHMLLPTIAYYIREWKFLHLTLAAPFLYSISFYWALPESPRWLILRGRYTEAVEIFKKIAYWNKRTLPCDEELLEMVKRMNIKESEEEGDKSGFVRRGLDQLGDLFQTRIKTIRTSVLFFCWFTTALTYFGVSLMGVHIGSNEYWYLFFGGLVEIPSNFMLWPLVHFVGRRLSLVGCLLMCAASILGSLGVGDSVMWKATLAMAGKFAIGAAFSLVYLLATETNTTKSRTLALGLSSLVGRLGSIGSPYVNDLIGEANQAAPALMYGLLSSVGALLSFVLPETRKAILPESRFDIENIGSDVARGRGSEPSRETRAEITLQDLE